MRFVWDDKKNIANQIKHSISFEQAAFLLQGVDYSIEYDSEHSVLDEDRYVAKGYVIAIGFICVIFSETIDDEIRIISARKIEESDL